MSEYTVSESVGKRVLLDARLYNSILNEVLILERTDDGFVKIQFIESGTNQWYWMDKFKDEYKIVSILGDLPSE